MSLFFEMPTDESEASRDPRVRHLLAATQEEKLDQLEQLIKNGAPIEAKEAKSGRSITHTAVYLHRHGSLKMLLDAGANPNTRNKKGFSCLADATHSHCKVCMTHLIEAGADLNSSEPSGFFPLLLAAELVSEKHSYDCLSLLLEAGAQANHQSEQGHMALFSAACEGRDNDIELLLKYGANINQLDTKNNYTALHYAIEFQHVSTVSLLLSHGADVELKATKHAQQLTALQYAQNIGNLEISAMIYAVHEMLELKKNFPALELFNKPQTRSL